MPPVPLVSLIPLANLPPDTGGGILILLPLFATGVNDTKGYWWQIYRWHITADFNNASAQLTAERDTWVHLYVHAQLMLMLYLFYDV
jgi:hypothetical protein